MYHQHVGNDVYFVRWNRFVAEMRAILEFMKKKIFLLLKNSIFLSDARKQWQRLAFNLKNNWEINSFFCFHRHNKVVRYRLCAVCWVYIYIYIYIWNVISWYLWSYMRALAPRIRKYTRTLYIPTALLHAQMRVDQLAVTRWKQQVDKQL